MSNAELLPIAITDVAPATRLASALLGLNNEHATELSWLTPERLTHLVRQAFCARRVGQIDAFLLAFDQDADYDSPNFLWFRARYERFVYVDRIVVAAAARGRGLARLLYRDLFAEAARAGHVRVVCEVNSQPPNPVSDAFHAALGFVEVGRAAIDGGAKTVRYLLRSLDGQAALAGGSASTE
jgi:predicted GNAT superfamily acetyltransferase